MRQKRVKQATYETLSDGGVLIKPELLDFKEAHVYLEIGSGKGLFITSLAKDNPENRYVALEININVCYRILEKKEAQDLSNLTIILGDASDLSSYFKAHSVDHIYLNFSDPWPKAKHHKRRLTYPTFLNMYEKILKKDGIIQFRTDHHGLFEDSLTYIKTHFDVFEITNDLNESSYMTEYEMKKRSVGPIYQLKARIKDVT